MSSFSAISSVSVIIFFSISLLSKFTFLSITGFLRLMASDKISLMFFSTASLILNSICFICSSNNNSELLTLIFGEYKFSP